jgi:hypothetical protein
MHYLKWGMPPDPCPRSIHPHNRRFRISYRYRKASRGANELIGEHYVIIGRSYIPNKYFDGAAPGHDMAYPASCVWR